VADAFRLYRNYDGRHGEFGDVSVKATSGDQSRLAVYAAQRSSDSKVTIAVVNKEPTSQSSTLAVDGASGAAETWRWAGDGIKHAPDTSLGSGAIDFPARSLTLFVLGSGGSVGPGGGGPAKNGRHCRKVPRGLVGRTLGKAKKKLQARHCRRPKVKRVHAKKRRRGRVVATAPRAGHKLRARQRIKLRVGR
jgi:hypothetical protein